MMSLSEIMFMAIVVYLLYRFIVNFLVPVMRATRQVREQFRNMHDQANGGGSAGNDASRGGAPRGGFQPGAGFGAAPGQGSGAGFKANAGSQQDGGRQPGAGQKRSSTKGPAEDYIDFEEIK
jgi:hypothetical protein